MIIETSSLARIDEESIVLIIHLLTVRPFDVDKSSFAQELHCGFGGQFVSRFC